MKILITGSNGLLGQKIVALLSAKGSEFLATSVGPNRNPDCLESHYSTLDITSKDAVDALIENYRPSHIIHTAAMTNVDQCESDKQGCELLNVTATKYLVDAANKVGAHLQLLSTDFIFDGEKGNYSEEDAANPLSVYAQSKVDAEAIVRNYAEHWSILRTIIVYGKGNNLSRSNLILWALDALPKGQTMNIVDDQFRAPTWADDLAWACVQVCEQGEKGIFHISGPETMSILQIVQRIAAHRGFPTEGIQPINSSTLAQAAKRPPKTGFDLSKARKVLGYSPKTLEETLDLL